MGMRSRLMTGILAGTLTFGGGAALAQDASPDASPSANNEIELELLNVDGMTVGEAMLTEGDDGVMIHVQSMDDSMIEPGEHGIHIHENGVCDPAEDPPFDSAGGHFNPTDASHGDPEDEDSHAGDLGNMTVEENGTFEFEITTDKVTLETGEEASLLNPNGTALLIHSGEDDLTTDPSGESGDRLACGLIFPPQAPDATPAEEVTDETEATPAS